MNHRPPQAVAAGLALALALVAAPAAAQTASITSTNPASLNAENLNGATLNLRLTGTTFTAGATAAHFSITTSSRIIDFGVSSVRGTSSGGTTATLRLYYAGGPIDSTRTFTVTVAAAAHAGSMALTTGNVTINPPSAANEPPVAVGSVDDLDLPLGESGRISLLRLFTDEVPERLRYSVSSSAPTVVSARLAWPSIQVEGLAHGTATVTLTATDEGGLSATLNFFVRSGTTIAFTADASAPEGGTIRLRLAASRRTQRALSVPYILASFSESATSTALTALQESSASGGSVSGDAPEADESDHTGGTGGMFTFPAGVTEATLAVSILDDDVVEPVRERFVAILAEPAADAGYGLGVMRWATATIDEGVCDRSPVVRDALRGRQSCTAVADLSRHTALRIVRKGLVRLQVEDLLELGRLRLLELSGNRLSEWPPDILEALPLLNSLHLDGNRISSLPEALDAHGQLAQLNLSRNQLTALPAGALRGFAKLEYLHLSDNELAALPGDSLHGLTSLRALSLDGNALQELPAGLFVGIGRLDSLQLQRNPGAPFTLTVEPTRSDAVPWAPGPASIAMSVSNGAPFAMASVLSVPNASLPDGAGVSVPPGQAQGDPVTVAAESPVIARLSQPVVPDHECEFGEGIYRPCFRGVTTAVAPLVLFKRPPRATAPVPGQALDTDHALRLDLTSFFGAADGEPLTFGAESSPPAVARVRVINGILIVDALEEGLATVTVTATDSFGQVATLGFELQTTRRIGSRWGRGWRVTLLRIASEVP